MSPNVSAESHLSTDVLYSYAADGTSFLQLMYGMEVDGDSQCSSCECDYIPGS